MSPGTYRISNSKATGELFKAIADEARKAGRRLETLRAARWIFEELERTPLEFGESRNVYHHLQLQMRIAFVRPLTILFGVHESSRTVFISRMALGKSG